VLIEGLKGKHEAIKSRDSWLRRRLIRCWRLTKWDLRWNYVDLSGTGVQSG
jgi:hypothetical protein